MQLLYLLYLLYRKAKFGMNMFHLWYLVNVTTKYQLTRYFKKNQKKTQKTKHKKKTEKNTGTLSFWFL